MRETLRVRLREQAARARCPYCHDALDASARPCERCASLHHADCLAEAGCAILGCEPARVQATARLPAPSAAPSEARRMRDVLSISLLVIAFKALVFVSPVMFGLIAAVMVAVLLVVALFLGLQAALLKAFRVLGFSDPTRVQRPEEAAAE